MVKQTSWQVILAAVLSFVGAGLDVISQTPIISDSKTGQSVFGIGTTILSLATAFGLYHAKGKNVTTGADGENQIK